MMFGMKVKIQDHKRIIRCPTKDIQDNKRPIRCPEKPELPLSTPLAMNLKTENVTVKLERVENEATTCRVCLQEGNIPIHGNDRFNDVSQDLNILTGVNVEKDDAYPKHLCVKCNYLLQGAMELRKTAQYSQRLLEEQAPQSTIHDDPMDGDCDFARANTGFNQDSIEQTLKNAPEMYISPCVSIKKVSAPKPQPAEYVPNSGLRILKISPDAEPQLVKNITVLKQKDQTFAATVPEQNIKPQIFENVSSNKPPIIKNITDIKKQIAKYLAAGKPKVTRNTNNTKPIKIIDSTKTVIRFTSDMRSVPDQKPPPRPKIIPVHCKKVKIITNKHKPETPGTYHCKWCNVYFGTKQKYRQHRKSQEHLFHREPCPVCHKAFTINTMRAHKQVHIAREISHICETCGQGFRTSTQLCHHRAKHSLELPIRCPQCPYRCKDNHSYTLHMRTHTGEKPYLCPHCPERFATNSNLHRHALTHKTEKEFLCDVCEKGFHYKRDLEKHINIKHLGTKDHACGMCGKAFSERKVLMRHERSVHKRQKHKFNRTPLYALPEYQKKIKSEQMESTSDADAPTS